LKIIKKNLAFTLIETAIAVTILTIIFTMVWKTYIQFMQTYHYFLVRNEVYDETHFLFEEMIRKIRSWNIDYQSYWRENTRITNWGNRIVDMWWTEWPNPKWSNASLTAIGNFNSIMNCETVADDNENDHNLTWTWKSIIENYLYQFIFPWVQQVSFWWGKYLYNFETSWRIHLNCKSDSVSSSWSTAAVNTTNIYDDDESYWRWPKAFSWSSPSWLWSWSWSVAWAANSNPPLLLLWPNWIKRYAFRHWIWSSATMCNNWTWCILMLESEAVWFNKNWIPDEWECLPDYNCPVPFTGLLLSNLWWKDITPSKIIVTEFEFDIWPEKNPYLAFNDTTSYLPSYFTIKISARSLPRIFSSAYGTWWISLDLQTTITSRNNSLMQTLN